MPPNEHFCLKWNNFQKNIVAALGNLKLDEDFVDVTLSCDGATIKAHKVILSACSDYFRDVFRDNPCTHPVVILRDTSFTDLEGLVRYIYRGEVDVQPEQLQSFLKTADLLKIKGLADQKLYNGHHHSQGDATADSETPNGSTSSPEGGATMASGPSVMQSQSSSEAERPSTFSATSHSVPTTNRVIYSPIKVPVPPQAHLSGGLKRGSNFTNLAQYLSGSSSTPYPSSGSLSPPPLLLTDRPLSYPSPVASSSSPSSHKRRKTTPKRYSDGSAGCVSVTIADNCVNSRQHQDHGTTPPQHYSGSTSSLTASPASPPHSHSTEGGDNHLEICEESDRESARSTESIESRLRCHSSSALNKEFVRINNNIGGKSSDMTQRTTTTTTATTRDEYNTYQDDDAQPLVICEEEKTEEQRGSENRLTNESMNIKVESSESSSLSAHVMFGPTLTGKEQSSAPAVIPVIPAYKPIMISTSAAQVSSIPVISSRPHISASEVLQVAASLAPMAASSSSSLTTTTAHRPDPSNAMRIMSGTNGTIMTRPLVQPVVTVTERPVTTATPLIVPQHQVITAAVAGQMSLDSGAKVNEGKNRTHRMNPSVPGGTRQFASDDIPFIGQGHSHTTAVIHHHNGNTGWCGRCPHCTQEYANISSLKYHVRLVHSEVNNTICCYLCPESFTTKLTMREHLLNRHNVKYQ